MITSEGVLLIVLLSIGIVLVAVGIWAVVEVAVTIRKARTKLDDLLGEASEGLGKVSTILDTADQTLQDLGPAVQRLPGLMAKGEEAVDALSDDLATADTILADISVLTGTAMNATNAISKGASQATTAIGGAVAKVGKAVSGAIAPKKERSRQLEAAAKAVEAKRVAFEERASEIADSVGVEIPPTPQPKTADDYFSYPSAPSGETEPTEAPAS